MSSGIITKIKLEPFYQEFLRGYYRNCEPVFKFPRHDCDELGLALKFINLLTPAPDDFKPENFGKDEFLIEVPDFHDRDPFYCNYISPCRNEKFIKKVDEQQKNHFHERLAQLRNTGFEYQDCIDIYMDELQINQQYFDRLLKDYSRWRTRLRVQKFRKKSHRLESPFCPASNDM